jgi:hypothetical protein
MDHFVSFVNLLFKKLQKKAVIYHLRQNKSAFNVKYKLLDWINVDNLEWNLLSINPRAISLLEQYPEKINWNYIQANSNKTQLSKQIPAQMTCITHEKINKIQGLMNNLYDDDNTSLEQDQDDIDRLHHTLGTYEVNYFVHRGRNPEDILLLQQLELDSLKINWGSLSEENPLFNANALDFLNRVPKNDNFCYMCMDPSPSMMHLLEKTRENIDWKAISINPSIFTIDYDCVTERMEAIKEELIVTSMHPKRIQRFLDLGGDIDDL